MLRWRLLAIVMLVACNGSTSAPDATSRELPMRIIVTPRSVQMYTDAADLGACSCNAATFPAAGACTGLTDANPCDGNPYCPSCITDFGVEVDGQRITPSATGGTDPHAIYTDDALPAGQLSIVLAGCGHPVTRIPLDGPAFPDVTATADYVNGNAHVAWSTSNASADTLLEISGGFGGELCHVQDVSDYTFANWPTALGATIWPLGSAMQVATPFGSATIWRAGAASPQFPMQ